MKKIAKSIFLRTLKHTGAFRCIGESSWRAGKLLILCYHGISMEDEHEWRPDTYMTPALFDERLAMLRSGGYTVLPLEEAINKLYSNRLPPKSVVITFDDGLYNFYSHAVPILEKYHYPATLYLTTYYCGRDMPVFPLMCSYLLWKKRGAVMKENPDLGLNSPVDLTSQASRDRAHSEIHAYSESHQLTAQQKDDLLKRLAAYLQIDYSTLLSKRLFHLMTPEEVKLLAKKGIDIQLHTHRHRTPGEGSLYQKEIIENREQIKSILGQSPNHFCYPSGVYKMHYLPILSELGIASATTCHHGLATAKMNRLLLPRFLDSTNVSPLQFESWLTGVGALWRQNLFCRLTV